MLLVKRQINGRRSGWQGHRYLAKHTNQTNERVIMNATRLSVNLTITLWLTNNRQFL